MGLRDVIEKEVVRAYLLSQCLEKGFRPSGCDVAYSIKKGLAHKKLVSITDVIVCTCLKNPSELRQE